jgi:hypothetical protein
MDPLNLADVVGDHRRRRRALLLCPVDDARKMKLLASGISKPIPAHSLARRACILDSKWF